MRSVFKVYRVWANWDAEHEEWLASFADKDEASDYQRTREDAHKAKHVNPQSAFLIRKENE